MIRALWSSASGMLAQELNIDTISNNLANVNTAGFKRNRVDFQDLMYQSFRTAGTTAAAGIQIPTGIQVGHGSRPVATQKIFSQGDFMQTEAPLDMVIEGDGFFSVLLPDGANAYTRAGAFKQDGQGRVVTSDGFLLQPGIIIPADATDISISSDGIVEVTLPNTNAPQQIGAIQLAKFTNPAGLDNIGRNLFAETTASGAPIMGNPGANGFGTLAQGVLEMSNVKLVEEMVNLIVAQRAYEISSKSIQAADEMLGIANNIKR